MSGLEHYGYDAYGNPLYRAVPPPGSGGGGGIGPQIAGAAIVIGGLLFGLNKCGVDITPDVSAQAAPAGGTAVGQKILRAAQHYNDRGYTYGGGHPNPGNWSKHYKNGSSRGLDCSGLVNVAVYDATGVNDEEVAQGYRSNEHWKKIPMRDARAGDILWRNKRSGDSDYHVVIVVSNGGSGKLTVFEAYSSRVAYSDQIRKSTGQSYSRFDGASRFTG